MTDDGCGMVRDDALLAFERHATSKLRNADDLLSYRTLGFRGEALPSIASVSRLRLETRAPEDAPARWSRSPAASIHDVEEAGLPPGTSIAVRDLFFNIPARRKFLKAESTELSHIASLVTHYALAHPEMHWELHSATNAMLVAPPVADHSQRIYQVFGKETLDQLIPAERRCCRWSASGCRSLRRGAAAKPRNRGAGRPASSSCTALSRDPKSRSSIVTRSSSSSTDG